MDIQIGSRMLGEGHPTFVIAEIGINHNGFLGVAKELITAAKYAGCDAVKFQKRTIPLVYSEEELTRPREVPSNILANAIQREVLPKESVERLFHTNFRETTNGDLKWALEFTSDEYKQIIEYCDKLGLLWFASSWDIDSVGVLEELNVPCHKVASASMTHRELLLSIRDTQKPVLLSTGMSEMCEVELAVESLLSCPLLIMHCVSTYPSADEEVNLRCIPMYRDRFQGIPIGYSGHERGVALTFAAVAHGAVAIERHITLDRTMWGSDQAASLEPRELKQLIRDIRRYEFAKGDGVKRLYPNEVPIRKKLRTGVK